MQKRLHLLIAMMILLVSQAMAQITTSGVNGKVTAKKAGTVTIKAKVTLNNGKTKTVSMKVKVKK